MVHLAMYCIFTYWLEGQAWKVRLGSGPGFARLFGSAGRSGLGESGLGESGL